MHGVKVVLRTVGALVALFLGASVVVAILDGLGVVETEDEPSNGSQARGGDKAGAGDRDSGGQKKDRESSSRWPLTRVVRVIDGDTVHTDKLGRVRLIGVDTPEEGQCYSTTATRFTQQRLGGQLVGYELGAERKDRYGRTLAYLYRDKNMHELDLLREGYARVLTIPPNDKYAGRFRSVARSARRGDEGVWGICERRARRARIRRRERRERARREARARREQREREAAPDPSGGYDGGSGDDFNVPLLPGD